MGRAQKKKSGSQLPHSKMELATNLSIAHYGEKSRATFGFFESWLFPIEKEELTAERGASSAAPEFLSLWRRTNPRSSWPPRAKSFPSRPAPVSVRPG